MYILNLKEIDLQHISTAGGKGASLGELLNNDFNVPSGFVLTSSAFDCFLKENKIVEKINNTLNNINYFEIQQIKNSSIEIIYLIDKAQISEEVKNKIIKIYRQLNNKFVAIRSSATLEDSENASWAGELESYLNISEDNLIERIKDCWKSLFSGRAIQYRKQKSLLNKEIGLAVVIQEMIDPIISGIAFTANPANNNRNQMVIEAGFGLGEAIVSGLVTPDTYILNNNDLSIVAVNVSSQEKELKSDFINGGGKWADLNSQHCSEQKMTDCQINKLGNICNEIAKHYGIPQDIEWCLNNNDFYIVQSRAITTL